MGFLSTVERGLGLLFEGTFRPRRPGRLAPATIAKKLVGEMERRKTPSVSRTYAPNAYTVVLHPIDAEAVSGFRRALAAELAEHLLRYAARRRYTVVGSVRVELSSSDRAPEGDVVVEGDFVEASELEERPRRGCVEARLVVAEGADTGTRFFLGESGATIGRAAGVEVRLSDPAISRFHAHIGCEKGCFVLRDAGSKNGTVVNNEVVAEKALVDGDLIRVGNTLLEFRTGEERRAH